MSHPDQPPGQDPNSGQGANPYGTPPDNPSNPYGAPPGGSPGPYGEQSSPYGGPSSPNPYGPTPEPQQPYGAPPQYGAAPPPYGSQPSAYPPGGPPGPYSGYPQSQGTNGLAIASMVCSILGICCVLLAIPGVILGHVALSQISRQGGDGRGMAIAGLVIGYLVLLLNIVLIATGVTSEILRTY